ncbi:MAG: response regulator [Deltaproteobacteria bacterium]|nr:response regulator [Deltaproteobacteria bacterium]
MDHADWIKEVLDMGVFESQCPQHEMIQFLGIIQRCAELLPLSAGVQQVCGELVKIVIEETNFENCSIVLWNGERQSLCLSAAYGLDDLLGGRFRQNYNPMLTFSRGEGIAGQVFQTRSPIFIENTTKQAFPLVRNATIRPTALACLPLMDLGVMNISARRPCKFPPQLRRNWELVSRVIGHLLVSIHLHEQFRRVERPSEDVVPLEPHLLVQNSRNDCRSSSFLEKALERMPLGVCILDAEGRVVRINESVEKLQGKGSGEMLGRSPAVLFKDSGVFESLLARAAKTGQEELSDAQLINAESDIYLADVHLVRLGDQESDLGGYLLVINDTTKKKAFAEKILQTEKLAALGTMAGGVAHDFNNLLMAILGNIQLVLPALEDEEVRRRLLNVEKAVHDGAHTVRRLQKFTERERENKSQSSAVDVNEAIRDVVELTRPRWKDSLQRQGHIIEFEMDMEPNCLAAIHASDFREVLTNLLFNAIEAMPEGGKITLRTEALKDRIVVQVGDTGIGMTEEVMSRIFDPYYTTKGVGNSGLGLSVSWSLVVRAGGEIFVKSKPGKGSVFFIKLPKASVPKTQAAGLIPARTPVSRRVLVVDDDKEVLGILQDMLFLKGHRVVAVDEGEKALDVIDREEFDLVLTDLGMPVVSGWEIAKRVKARTPKTPVILITGWGGQYEDEDLTGRGVDSVLSKPLSWEKLLAKIDSVL